MTFERMLLRERNMHPHKSTRSQLTFSISVSLFIRLIIKNNVSSDNATGTTSSFIVFPIVYIDKVLVLSKFVRDAIVPYISSVEKLILNNLTSIL